MIHNLTSITQNSKGYNPLLWGTIGYLFLFIFRPFEYWEWLGTYRIERIYMICLIMTTVSWSGKRYYHHPITTVLLSLFSVICFSALVSPWTNKALDMVWEYFKLIVLFFVIILSVRDEREFRILVVSFLAITGIYIGKSLWEFFIHGRHVYRMGIRRLIGIDKTFSDPNTFAATIIYSLPFVWALWKTKPSPLLKKGLIFYGAMSIVAIVFTGSRAGMLSFIFLLFLLWLRGNKKVIGSVAVILILSIGWYVLPQDYRMRFETIYDDSINPSATTSAEGRRIGFQMGMKLFEMSPVWGWGAGCSPLAAKEILNYDLQVQLHNFYAQLLSELGILGAIPFLTLLFFLIRCQKSISFKLNQSHSNYSFLNEVSIASTNTMWLLLFQGIFGHNLYRYTWIWISAVLVLAQYFSKPNLIIKET